MTPAGALGRDLVRYALGELPDEALADAATRLLARTSGAFSLEGADALADVLEARTAPAARDGVLAALATTQGPAGRYASARLLAAWARPDDALAQLDAALDALPEPDAHLLALRARWQQRRGNTLAAARDLRRALETHPPYAFYPRVEKLVEKLAAAAPKRRSCRLAILASSTTSLLAPVLRASLFSSGISAEIYEGAYGGYRQEVLDPTSGLHAFAPDITLILVNHRDVDLPPDGGAARAAAFGDELRALWKTLQSRTPCHVIQVAVDTPTEGAWGPLEDTLPEGRRRVLAALNASLGAALPPGVSVLNTDVLAARDGRSFFSERDWDSTRQYPAPDALPLFADAVCAHVRAALGLASKVLVLDLDNTLWGGVIGEDGVGGIKLGPPDAVGEGHAALQRYARELKSRGILLAVCSKNNPADAELPFRTHEAMALKLEDFVAFRANWDDKASNLRAMAKDLALGLDSFVFLDDNPVERAWVRRELPEVAVPEARATPWDLLAALRRGMYFEATVITCEDTERQRSYEAGSAMRVAQEHGTVEDFLAGLGMRAEHGPVDAATVARVAQLINKTNQFNLTARRYTAEQVRQMAGDPAWWTRWFRLSDRFGEHGLVGVMLARREPGTWRIDSWLMSCRVLGRRMEEFMCATALRAARADGAAEVLGEFVPTEKNAMVRELYPRMGFAGDDGRYRFDVARAEPPASPWITSVERGARERDAE